MQMSQYNTQSRVKPILELIHPNWYQHIEETTEIVTTLFGSGVFIRSFDSKLIKEMMNEPSEKT
jgi:hypothetical protein